MCRRFAERLPRDGDQDRPYQQNRPKAFEEVYKDLFEVVYKGRRGRIFAVFSVATFDKLFAEASGGLGRQTPEDFVSSNCVPFELKQVWSRGLSAEAFEAAMKTLPEVADSLTVFFTSARPLSWVTLMSKELC